MDMILLGKKIKNLRKGLKMRQEDLARDVVTRGYISQIEKGNAMPSFEIISKLAERLNCSITFLLEEEVPEAVSLPPSAPAQLVRAEQYLENNLLNEFLNIIKSIEITEEETDLKAKQQLLYARYYWLSNDMEKAHEYIEDVIQNAPPFDYDIRAKSYNLQGQILYRTNQLTEALKSFNNALLLTKQFTVDKLLYVDVLLNLGIFHCHLDEITSALTHLLEAQQINLQNSAFYKAGEISMTMGVCYKKTGNWEEAKLQYEQSLLFFEQTNNKKLKAGSLLNLGILYKKIKNYDESLAYIEKSIEAYSLLSDEEGLINSKLELAELYIDIQNIKEAEKICNDFLHVNMNLDLKAQLNILIGRINSCNGNLAQALDHFFLARTIYQQKQAHKKISELYVLIAEAYYHQKDFETASYYYRQVLPAQ